MTPTKKARIKERDSNRCVICNSREQLTIDHIVPISEGGTNEDDNLRTLCVGCNLMKANKPPKHRVWFNLLFSRKTIFEFKNEIKGEMAARDGKILEGISAIIEQQKQQIDQLDQQLKNQQNVQLSRINQLAERIRSLQDYHKLEWHEETIKGYKKKNPRT